MCDTEAVSSVSFLPLAQTWAPTVDLIMVLLTPMDMMLSAEGISTEALAVH